MRNLNQFHNLFRPILHPACGGCYPLIITKHFSRHELWPFIKPGMRFNLSTARRYNPTIRTNKHGVITVSFLYAVFSEKKRKNFETQNGTINVLNMSQKGEQKQRFLVCPLSPKTLNKHQLGSVFSPQCHRSNDTYPRDCRSKFWIWKSKAC